MEERKGQRKCDVASMTRKDLDPPPPTSFLIIVVAHIRHCIWNIWLRGTNWDDCGTGWGFRWSVPIVFYNFGLFYKIIQDGNLYCLIDWIQAEIYSIWEISRLPQLFVPSILGELPNPKTQPETLSTWVFWLRKYKKKLEPEALKDVVWGLFQWC